MTALVKKKAIQETSKSIIPLADGLVDQLIKVNKELLSENREKDRYIAELVLANKALAYQALEKADRASELVIAKKDKSDRAKELIVANETLALYKAAEEELRQLVFIDPLTKLFTRSLLLDRLEQSILKTARNKKFAAILFVDLDCFKRVNDLFGHQVGDLRLIDVARRLKACVRAEDTVARIGGDEFLVLINELSPDIGIATAQITKIAQKIVEALSAKACLKDPTPKPCKLDDKHQCQCSASVGIALFSGKGRTTTQLIAQADVAMYQAKEGGKKRCQLFDADIKE